jgi:hypothetical protein
MELAGLAHLTYFHGRTAPLRLRELTFTDFSLGRFPTPYPFLTLNRRFPSKNPRTWFSEKVCIFVLFW